MGDPVAGRPRIVVLTDAFPVLSETFVTGELAALGDLGADVSMECAVHGGGPPVPGALVHALTDDPRAARARDLAWLLVRHPRGVGRDLRSRRRWRRQEGVRPLRQLASRIRRIARARADHLHVHFATGTALDTMRIAAILGLPYSVTAHANDIFVEPRNLVEKLSSAAFTTTGCEYNARHLRGVLPPAAGARLHVVLMGVDPEVFTRAKPRPEGRRVLAVGRLVAKKGFGDLLAALALMDDATLTLVGQGALRRDLETAASRLGVRDRVTFTGALDPAGVRAALEATDVLCAPCVVAPDGDRDSMPVVVKEAMAMEVPVVVTDQVGLPEMVGEDRGRVVAAGDPAVLAAALGDVLERDAEGRGRLGRAGRSWVAEHADVHSETAKLLALIAAR